ncbi:MAG: TrkH family potassium uptake protein, partial [Butyricicoccaceae bacterium]
MMNYSTITYILGWILKLESLLLCFPSLVALLYWEQEGLAFLGVALLCLLLGVLLTRKKPQNPVFYSRESFVTVALCWIVLSFFGALPFVLSGDIPHLVDALFETISGFTTTGASILNDIESLSHCSLLWRSFTHWIGGMGVLVFLLAVLPMAGGSSMHLMQAESPGPSVGKLVPKVRYTAMILYGLYIALTVLQILLLLLAKMPLFEAVTTAFGTAGTGGFAVKNDSLMSYSSAIQWIVTIFMILFGVNFHAFFSLISGKWRRAARNEEVRAYLVIILAATAIIFVNIYSRTMGAWDNLRHAMFHVASIITTTGFATADFQLWPEASKTVLVVLMMIGACAGSTGGGIKVARILIVFKTV